MKNIIIMLIWSVLLIQGCAAQPNSTTRPATVPSTVINGSTPSSNTTDNSELKTGVSQNDIKILGKIQFTVGGHIAKANIYDTPTGRSLMEQLPQTVKFSDYNNTEKIAYPEKSLSIEGAPESYVPKRGDITVYGPWGNVAIFYRDFRVSPGLILVGQITEGLDFLAEQNGEFSVQIEKTTDK